MSFNIGLSGLRAATKDLNVTGNNIANAGTAGFKQSRAEFADVYAASVVGSGSNPTGSGVLLSNVSQMFNQGNINYTQNSLDLAINGNGFFVTSNNGDISYTRAGYFGTDREGNLVNNFGYKLQGYPVDGNGNLQNGVVSDLTISTSNQAPKSTTQIAQKFNLNSATKAPTNTPFNPSDPTTYTSSTSVNIYDSQGNAHVMTQYFINNSDPTATPAVTNNWTMNVLIDGRNPANPVADPGDPAATPPVPPTTGTEPYSINLMFNSDGSLNTTGMAAGGDLNFDPDTGLMTLDDWVPATSDGGTPATWAPNGANNPVVPMQIDLRGSTQYASAFAVNSVSQDGYTTGQLSGLEIDDTGVIFARYTNGQSKVQGQVVLANFANVQGLTPMGKTAWTQSFDSGEPVIGTPSSGTLGALQSGALEDSNVDLSDQLVNLIVAQRNYQANAKTIETESAITQTIINLR
ncbi:flagellar hook protein FlgE [Pseudomonas sp. UL073]|uniref:Flagellar hook protein FlgE n=1 Tax=Zestomonas insulae TaxID=2809017 RepID=A0ABS2ICK3_9GAMM|nr:flagellar hook protein FlgE [Pseudomonas insulae]MBM7059585.1 flagellar hook protein FlgE [Pseudomonas insulae]